MALLFPMEKCLISFYHRVAFIAQFDDSSPSVTWDKEICHMIMSYCHHYHLRRSTQWNPFNDVCLLSRFDVSSFSLTEDIYLRTGYFTTLSSSKLIFILLTLGMSELTLFISFYWLWTSQLLYSVWVSYVAKNNPNSPLDKNPKIRCRIWHKLFSMIPSAGIKTWFPHSINRL